MRLPEYYVKNKALSQSWKYYKLDMSTARRRLKSPQSLYGTSTHPTKVTHRSQSWSWMIYSHPFRSMLISPAFLKYGYFKLWPCNYKVNVMCEVKGQGHIVCPVSNRCTSFSFHINQTKHFWDMSNRVFDLGKTHPKFSKKICQKRVSKIIPHNLIRRLAWPEGCI